MRLRPASEYAEAIRAILPASVAAAPDYRTVAQQTAGRLGLTQGDLERTRQSGRRHASQHRSTLSAVLFRMKRRGQVCAEGSKRRKCYWLPSPTTVVANQPTYEQIACRAYEIYAGRGYADGNDKQDWLRAERELLGG